MHTRLVRSLVGAGIGGPDPAGESSDVCVCVCVCVSDMDLLSGIGFRANFYSFTSSIMHTDLLSRAWRVAGRRIIGDCTTPLVNITSLGRPPPRRRGRPATTYEHSPCYRRVMHTTY